MTHLAVGGKVDGGHGGREGVDVPEVALNLTAQGVEGVLLDIGDLLGEDGEVNSGGGHAGGHVCLK